MLVSGCFVRVRLTVSLCFRKVPPSLLCAKHADTGTV